MRRLILVSVFLASLALWLSMKCTSPIFVHRIGYNMGHYAAVFYYGAIDYWPTILGTVVLFLCISASSKLWRKSKEL